MSRMIGASDWRLRPRAIPYVIAGGMLMASAAGVWADTSPISLPRPGPQSRAPGYDPVEENARCEGCHTEIAAEWRGSQHRSAWDDPVFQAGYAIEREAFCRECHAPEYDPKHEPAEARHTGVGCVTCHVQGETKSMIVGARSLAAKTDRHAVLGDPRMASSRACAACHQFEFLQPQDAAMQSTLEEHADSPYAAASCQSCHMPPVSGPDDNVHKSHRFSVQGDREMLRAAIDVSAPRAEERSLVLVLRASKVGHAVPTGDMFRRLEVRAQIDGGPSARPVVLARRFRMTSTEHGPARIQVGDDRLPATGDSKEIELRFSEDIAGRDVLWEVAYQRMDAGMAQIFGIDHEQDEVVVAQGTWKPKKVPR